MLELSDDAVRVLTQLKTTVQSYDSLMEKLEVDISVVERRRNVSQNFWRIMSGKSTVTLEKSTIIQPSP